MIWMERTEKHNKTVNKTVYTYIQHIHIRNISVNEWMHQIEKKNMLIWFVKNGPSLVNDLDICAPVLVGRSVGRSASFSTIFALLR